MSTKDSIVSGILKYSISTWINLVVGFLSVIITTRIISPDVYGQVSIFFSVTSVIMYVFTLGLDGALIRFYNEPPNDEPSSNLVYKCIILSISASVCIGGALTYFWGDLVSDYIFGVARRVLTGMIFLYAICQVLLRYLNISYRMSFKTLQYTLQNVLINCLSRALLICIAFFTNDFTYIVITLTLGLFLVTIVYIAIQKDEITPKKNDNINEYLLNFEGYSNFFKFAIFSAPTYIVVYLNTYLNQQIIVSSLGAYSLGIFASTSMFSAILTGLQGGFGTYWSAYVYKKYKYEKEKISRMHSYVVLFSIVMASCLICFRDYIYMFIGAEFHESKSFFSLLLMGPLLSFISETTTKGIAIANKNQILVYTNVIAIIVNIIFCILFIHLIGLKGAAVSNAFSALLLYSLNTFYGQKYYKSINNSLKSVIGIMILSLILLSAAIFSEINYIITFVLILDIISVLIFISEVKYIIKLVKQKIYTYDN